jgi:hypothetical protein
VATNLSNDISWLLEIDESGVDFLGPIRHWQHLSMAAAGGMIWVRGLRSDDLGNSVLRGIPHARVLYLRGDHLYPENGLVPTKKMPPGLNWRPLSKGLPLGFPSFNHNYFGIGERLAVRLVASTVEASAVAVLLPVETLRSYAIAASAVRLRHLRWIVLGREALVIGTPMLPLPGRSFWQLGEHLLPAGYTFEFPILAETIGRRLCRQAGDRVFWSEDGSCLVLAHADVVPLSPGSIRMTVAILPAGNTTL